MNVCIKLLPNIPSYEIVLFRSVISFVLTLTLLLKLKIFPFGSGRYLFLIMRGLAGSAALLIYFYTLQKLPLATAVTVQYLAPLFTVLFAAFLLKEQIRWQQWLFMFISFAGVVLIRGFDPRFSTGLLLLGVLAAGLTGFAYNAVRKAGETEHALVVVFYLPLVTIPVITPFAISNWVMPSGSEWLLLLAVGILTQIAQVYLTRAYQMAEAKIITPYTYLGILFAIAFSILLFRERYNPLSYLGMAVVMAGVVANFLFILRITNLKRLRVYLRHFPGA